MGWALSNEHSLLNFYNFFISYVKSIESSSLNKQKSPVKMKIYPLQCPFSSLVANFGEHFQKWLRCVGVECSHAFKEVHTTAGETKDAFGWMIWINDRLGRVQFRCILSLYGPKKVIYWWIMALENVNFKNVSIWLHHTKNVEILMSLSILNSWRIHNMQKIFTW